MDVDKGYRYNTKNGNMESFEKKDMVTAKIIYNLHI